MIRSCLRVAHCCCFWRCPRRYPPTRPHALPTGVSAGPCVEGICEYRLENGLRVLIFPRDWPFEAGRDAAYASLTAGQVNAAIRKHLKPEKLSVFVAGHFSQ
jgi:hypothetical protein